MNPPPTTRILLSEGASRHLDAAGHQAFAVIARDMSDDRTGRWVLHLIPCSLAQAQAACDVATGKSKARPIKAAGGAVAGQGTGKQPLTRGMG